MDFNQKHSKVFYGWYIVGACFLITIYTGGVVNLGFTAVFDPIRKEFSWSYAQISLAASLRGLEVGLLAPVLGHLVDRWGPRRLVFGGGVLVCVGFLVLSSVHSLAMFYGAFALIAIGMSTFAQTVIISTVAKWFRRKAGIAIGIVASGFGVGGFMVPVVTKLIDALQWRMAVFVLGLGMLAIVLPLSLLIRHKPEHYGYQPDGGSSNVVEPGDVQSSIASAEVNVPAGQAIRNRAFWHLSIASMCHSFVVSAVITHVMPFLSSLAITRSLSSLVALVLPVVSIGGRLSGGWLADRLGSRQVFAASFVGMTAGLLIFGYVSDERMWLLVPFIITFSLGWGCSVTTRFSVQREYFGVSSFGTILGFISGVMMLGQITGAPLAGWVFDTWNSYKVAWLCFSALTITGAVLALTIPSSSSNIRQSNEPATQRVTK